MMGTLRKATGSLHLAARIAAAFLPALLSTSSIAASFAVTSTVDGGSGSLRQAILDSEATLGNDVIAFNLPGSGPFTITPALGPLPSIREPVTIDGTTQPGYAGAPRIELRGSSAGETASGLYLLTSNCVIRALCINRFGGDGIRIENGSSNVVQGCYIGTTSDGRSAAANTLGGVTIQSAGNVIGGINPGERNVISGGNQVGIFLFDANARHNQVLGNYIGVDATGTNRLGNAQNGILVSSAPENQIGGSMPGAGNVISANGLSGIYIMWPGASGNRVEGNSIGTGASGALARGNLYGVTILGGKGTIIGGTLASARNVISGNASNGVHITSSPAGGGTSNLVQGNFIGTDRTGTNALANGVYGVEIYRGSDNVVGDGNVISGNAFGGVTVAGGTSANNRISGNLIGTDISGTKALPNGLDGVLLEGVSNNTVGGATAAERNVISGNLLNGVFLASASAQSNTIQGNYIGTDITGQRRVGNGFSGVRIEGPHNRVGSDLDGARNVISGNFENGVFLYERSASNNVIAGNWIGLDATGSGALGNAFAGVWIANAPANTIGGSVAGTGNVISANGQIGIYLELAVTAWNVIQGNFIGTDISGLLARGNALSGISAQSAPSNFIGGAVASARNVISANGRSGIRLRYRGTDGWVIQGNLIGTAVDGLSNLGNWEHGIELYAGSAASHHVIGGTVPGEGNRIAYATQAGFDGVRIRDGCTNNLVVGNALFANGGTAASGLGIDLGVDGVTPNDPCDGDTDGNQLQNFPELTNAYASATATAVRGTLNSVANKTCLLHFYANPTNEPSGYGEGQVYLGQIAVRTAANCTTNFAANLPVGASAGYFITATATDAANNTSEFSQGIAVWPQPALTWSNAPASRLLMLAWTNTAQGFALRQATNLSPPVFWSPVTNAPALSGDRYVVPLPTTNGNRFYLLTLP